MTPETLIGFAMWGKIFPLAAGTKKPMKGWRWREKNTDSIEMIYDWAERYPEANWALIPTRCVVVDVDCKDGAMGKESLETHGGISPTFTVRTPSGGSHHYYFRGMKDGITSNSIVPGVDIRGDARGFVVLPYSVTRDGRYEIVNGDVYDELPTVPGWIDELIQAKRDLKKKISGVLRTQPSADVINTGCDFSSINQSPTTVTLRKKSQIELDSLRDWIGVRKQVRFLFFRKPEGRMLWKHQATPRMKDRSHSAFSFQMVFRLAVCGATPDEIRIAHDYWCQRNNVVIDRDRFENSILPDGLLAALPYIQEWTARQPKTRKHGTTQEQILDAIRSGATVPKAITEHTGRSGPSIRKMLGKMVSAGVLTKSQYRYAIAESRIDQDELQIAA